MGGDYQSLGLYVGIWRRCRDENDVNCFSVTGCTDIEPRALTNCSSNASISEERSIADPGWEIKLVFIGSGLDFMGRVGCHGSRSLGNEDGPSSSYCDWSTEDEPLHLGWRLDGINIEMILPGPQHPGFDPTIRIPSALDAIQNLTYILSMRHLRGTNLDQHTLSLKSEDGPIGLELLAGHAILQTEANTPVGLEDNIWIPARHQSFTYDSLSTSGWHDEEQPMRGLRATSAAGGSAAAGFIGDQYELKEYILQGRDNAGSALPQYAVNGIATSKVNSENLDIGQYTLNVSIAGISNNGVYALEGMWFHPASNVTRISDVLLVAPPTSESGLGGSPPPNSNPSPLLVSSTVSFVAPSSTDSQEIVHQTATSTGANRHNRDLIVGCAVGGAVALAAILGAILVIGLRRRRRRKAAKVQEGLVTTPTPYRKAYHEPAEDLVDFGVGSPRPATDGPQSESIVVMQMLHSINNRIDGLSHPPPQYSETHI